MCTLYFISTNMNKYKEIHEILKQHEISVKFLKRKLQEIQANSLDKIAAEKSKAAYNMISMPVLVEDDGLFINGLKGFPGPYSSFVFSSIGNEGILKLLSGSRKRE
ncbi:MAG TPA: non-canonical purine NTP pyrophosphatase, partial [Candidatus Nitrosopolaris sp.]|nr:non-canonical purine NTP pyrophosphatase [Candidatus Nitrosopolaris sp.]